MIIDEILISNLIKIFIFNVISYFISIKTLNIKNYWSKKYKLIFLVSGFIVAIICELINNILSISSIMYMIILNSIIFSVITKNKLGYSILINTISTSINLIIFFIATIISFILYTIFKLENEYSSLTIIIVIYLIITNFSVKIKRIKNGFAFFSKSKNDELFNVLILVCSVVTIFIVILLSNYKENSTLNMIISLMIVIFVMIITIQKSLQVYYKQRMLVKDLEETKKELEDKKAEVKELEKENLNFSKISHTIAHRQKVLEHKLEELNMNSEISNELGARIEDITKDLKRETAVELSKTGIEVIDDMLSYMQSECIKNKIDFQLQLNGNIYTMTNHYIGKDELEILLADHIKDAIIAIGYADTVNKSILVRLGKINGIYSLYIYDSGIEFEIDTFKELGIKPSTTHKDNGGTGMGFMNTFDTLRKYKASLEIKEIGKPCKDNFTKVLKFKFDNKEEFTIKSYRKDEIKKKDKENKLNLI